MLSDLLQVHPHPRDECTGSTKDNRAPVNIRSQTCKVFSCDWLGSQMELNWGTIALASQGAVVLCPVHLSLLWLQCSTSTLLSRTAVPSFHQQHQVKIHFRPVSRFCQLRDHSFFWGEVRWVHACHFTTWW